MDFHLALSGVGKIINFLWPVLQTSDSMSKIFGEKLIVYLCLNLRIGFLCNDYSPKVACA